MLNTYEKAFLEAYYKAGYTSDSGDWLQAALAAKRMFNFTRLDGQSSFEETEIRKKAVALYDNT